MCALAMLVAPGALAASLEDEVRSQNAALQRAAEGDHLGAAVRFAELAQVASSPEVRLKSEYELAQALLHQGLPGAALRQYAFVVQAGPKHPYYLKAIEGLVSVSEVLHEDVVAGAILDKEYSEAFAQLSPEVLGRVNYLVGAAGYRKDKRQESLDFLLAVPLDSPAYARARYLAGVLQARAGDGEKGLATFRELLALRDGPRLSYLDLATLQPLAQLGLARVLYGLGRYEEAAAAYEAIPRFSEHWDEGLQELAWTRFQLDDPGGALGALQSLHAPQYADSFQPESWILKATVYYYRCLYDDAKTSLARFDATYLPIAAQLQKLVAANREPAFYFALLEQPDALPRQVRADLLGNHRVGRFRALLAQLERERSALADASALRETKLGPELVAAVDSSRTLAAQLAGSFVKKRLDDAARTILGFDGQKEILRFEIARSETELLEARFDQKRFLGDQALHRPKMPGSSWEYWQFEGEFWLDEIGYYQYTLKSGCPSREE